MIHLGIDRIMDITRTSINGIEVYYHISIGIIVIRDSIMSTHIICIVPLGIVITSARCTSSIYPIITNIIETAKGMVLTTLIY